MLCTADLPLRDQLVVDEVTSIVAVDHPGTSETPCPTCEQVLLNDIQGVAAS